MSETNIDKNEVPQLEFKLTSESGEQLSVWLTRLGFQLWGHGTPSNDKDSFFQSGVLMLGPNGTYGSGGYDSITSIAIPLLVDNTGDNKDIRDIEYMTHWPLQRNGNESPRVVLLAIPNGNEKLPASVMDQYLVDTDEETSFPAELVVGFFNPDTLNVELNSAFTPTKEIREKYLTLVEKRLQAIGEAALLGEMPAPLA